MQIIGVYGSIFQQIPISIDGKLNQIASASLNYEVFVSKVCLSCSEVDLQVGSSPSSDDENIFLHKGHYGFQTYCGRDSYGYDATHSALVFSPADPDHVGESLPGKLRGFLFNRGTRFGINDYMTQFPPDLDAYLQSNIDPLTKFFFLRDYTIPLIAASNGAISIMPDHLGHGESAIFNRPYLQPMPYMQTAVLSWLATKDYIRHVTNGDTIMDDVVTVTGYSEGGFSSIVGSQALKKLGVRIRSMHVGGVPYDLNKMLGYNIGKFNFPC